MTLSEVNRLFGQPESQTLEFKSSADPRVVAEVVCGMLNSIGGVVAIGVIDDGTVVGIDDAEGRSEELERYLQEQISPSAPWSILVTEKDDKAVIMVDVPSGSRKPYVMKGRVFMRTGQSNRPATADDVNLLIQGRIKADAHWERQLAVGLSLGDLDATEVEKMARQAIEAGRFDSSDTTTDDVLRRLDLIVDGRPLQAAIVAFGSRLLPWYPQCSLRLARFRGVTKDEFIDQRKVSAHAFRLLEEAGSFLNKHLPISGTFEQSFRRKDRPLYPVLALREALVNAFCHRDYSIPGGAINVAIFDDRLEIASSGTLPAGISVDDLKRSHFSTPRNPLLADLFYRRGLIDLWGRGTENIVRLCVEDGCPEPQFEERAGEFLVRFFAPNFSVSTPSGLDLSERQSRILAMFHAKSKRTLRELREGIDVNLADSTIRNDLNLLREHGLVEAVGVGRGAFWRLVRLPL